MKILKKIDFKMKEMVKNKKTIILVSHYRQYLENFCSRYIIMHYGNIVMDGGGEVLRHYFNKS